LKKHERKAQDFLKRRYEMSFLVVEQKRLPLDGKIDSASDWSKTRVIGVASQPGNLALCRGIDLGIQTEYQ
jgi:hypothetical protein